MSKKSNKMAFKKTYDGAVQMGLYCIGRECGKWKSCCWQLKRLQEWQSNPDHWFNNPKVLRSA